VIPEIDIAKGRVRAGSIVGRDIVLPNGEILIPAGHVLTNGDLKLLSANGVSEVIVADPVAGSATPPITSRNQSIQRQESRASVEQSFRTLPSDAQHDQRPYAAESLAKVEKCLLEAAENFNRAVHRLSCSLPVPLSSLKDIWLDLHNVTKSDPATALSKIAETQAEPNDSAKDDDALVKQSVVRASLATVMAVESGLDKSTCSNIAMAGLMHDVALLDEVQDLVRSLSNQTYSVETLHRDHSILGSHILAGVDGVGDSVISMMCEVHEQVDGSGFPFGLTADRISFGGRILSVASAFAKLTCGDVDKPPYFASDALAHLVYHTQRGAFDTDAVYYLLHAASIYPVGNRVELSDGTIARVYRSTGDDFTKPIVLCEDSQELRDLRQTDTRIEKPVQCPQQTHVRRIKMSAMENRLWV
jgi:HD-GYP domain-containing protein (c-di-GMP phosphodiesterase class II)